MLRFAILLLALWAVAPGVTHAGTTTPASTLAVGGLRHGVIWYGPAPSDAVRQTAAARYSVGITGKGERSDVDKPIIKSLNPEFRWFVYNSGTDNYVVAHPTAPGEHDLLVSVATQHGWDPEDGYLHFYDDTLVALDGDTLFVPGWGGGSAANGAAARIPVYYADMSRRLVHFSTRRASQLHKEVFIRLAFDTPFSNSTLYPDGIFVDNAAFALYNFGTVLSGGRVRETPGYLRLGSPEFGSWHWNSSLGPFLTALKDSLQTSASWSRDGQRKFLMINVTSAWDDSYASRDVADVLFLEYQYNPVRAFGSTAVDDAHRRDVLAASAGITTFYSAVMTRSVAGRAAEFTYAQTLLGNLAWYLVTRTDNTLFFPMGTSLPAAAGWDTLSWRGCFDVANERLGRAVGAPYTLAQGVDPVGNSYVVKARRYENGLAVVRNRGDWNQGIEVETAVSVPLPQSLLPVDPAGNLGSPVQSMRLRNGQGALFLASGTPSAYTLSTTAIGSGFVRSNPYQTTYGPGSSVSLWAIPTLGWRFARWEGDLSGSTNPVSIVMNTGHSVTAVFTLNAAPVPANDAYSQPTGSVLRVPAPGVLANDRDPDSDPITVSLRTSPTHGALGLEADGSFVYIPVADFVGTDHFVYDVRDPYSGMASASVTITVNGATGAVAFAESQSGGSSASATVTTATALESAPGALYLAAIASKPARAVNTVTGLGLEWTRVRAQCAGRGQTGIEIWMAQGPALPGTVTAQLATAPQNAVISVCRYTGAASTNGIGAVTSANSNGIAGACTGGIDGARYAVDLSPSTGGLVFGVAAMRNKTHTPDAGITERAEIRQGTSGDEASIAIVERAAVAGSTPLAGSFSSTTDWAVVAVEIRPAPAKTRATPLASITPTLQLFPNPARRTTAIRYDLTADAVVRVTMLDAAGRRIRAFAALAQPAGSHRLVWNGRSDAGTAVPSGVYFVQVDLGGQRLTRKLVLQQ